MLQENCNVLIFTDIADFERNLNWSRTAGPYRIASEIRANGYSCQLVDCFTDFTDDQFYEIFDKVIGPDTLIVGMSSTFLPPNESDENKKITPFSKMLVYPFELERIRRLFEYIRKRNPNTKIVIGGAKAHNNTSPYADTLIEGLGDKAIIEYLKFLQGKNSLLQYSINNRNQLVIDGDYYHNTFNFQQSQIVYSPYDNIMPNETLAIEVGRGCIFKCKFCSYNLIGKKKNDYIKEHSVLREEFIRNFNEYGITQYIYTDDTHNDSIDKLRQMADVVQSLPFKLEYSTYLRLDLIRAFPEQYQLLKDGGLLGAFFGIETLNYDSAKLIGKGMRTEHVIEELHKFREKMPHVATKGSFIVGLPKETKETIQAWTDQLKNPEFPVDGVLIQPLGMNNMETKKYRSEFEKESNGHYSWDTYPSNNWNYQNKFDVKWATEHAQQTRRNLVKHNNISGFETTTSGHASGKYFGKLNMEENFDEIKQLRHAIRQEYIKRLFSN